MKIMAIVLSALFAFQTSSVQAEAIRPADDSLLKLNLVYTQQEQGMVSSEILAPTMGRFGRLGLNLGNTDYYVRDINNNSQKMQLNQHALAWRSEDSLLSLNNDVFFRALGFVTTLRLGQTVYESLDELNKKKSHFTFFEVDGLFQLASSQKKADRDKWIKGSSVGIGSGFRLNFIRRQTFIGSTEVNRMRVFPTIQVALSLF